MIREFFDVTKTYSKVLKVAIDKASAPYFGALKIIATRNYIEFLANHPLPISDVEAIYDTLTNFEIDAATLFEDLYGPRAFKLYLRDHII